MGPSLTTSARPIPDMRPQYLQRSADELYRWQAAHRPVTEVFELHDGPPYANGGLHVGHALNKILKDMTLRVQIQKGRRVRYVPGWDCHGLPIELKALAAARGSSDSVNGAEHNDPTRGLTPLAIRGAARDLAARTVKAQMAEFRSFGVLGDWDARWTTMDAAYEVRQLRLFQALVRKGLIDRRYRPVYWSPSSRTALAEAELEYHDDHVSTAAFVRFRLVTSADGPIQIPGYGRVDVSRGLSAVVWTTTPWTLPANEAIAVHRDLEYAVVAWPDGEHLLVAASCLDTFASVCCTDGPPTVVARGLRGADLLHLRYTNPLRGQRATPQPVLHADFVVAGSGTGLVHMAPGHGFEDYEVCRTYGLPVPVPVDDAGAFTAEAFPDAPPRLQGLPVLGEGMAAVLALLDNTDSVLGTHALRHKYPYDWRTKQPIVVRATAQWFADVASTKDRAVASLSGVRFVPAAGRNRLASFVQGRSEWCISRQRAWGVPIPALHGDDGRVVLTDESVGHIVDVVATRGTDAWWADAVDDAAWIAPAVQAAHPDTRFRRGTETMDVWFDSGTSWTHMDEAGQRRSDVYLEGTDQHRGWFQSSLLTRVAVADTTADVGELAPFRALVTHGFLLDGEGRKMSKSQGNVVSATAVMDGTLLPPLKPKKGRKKTGSRNGAEHAQAVPSPIHDALGPDALRLWVASSDYTGDIVLSEPVLQATHAALVKYRVVIKMLLGSMRPFTPAMSLTTLDRISLLQLEDAMAEVVDHYARFEFYRAVAALNRWLTVDLSAFFLEAAKDRLYCADARDSAAALLVPLFFGLTRMLAPVVPLLVEEAWDHAPAWLRESHPSPLHQLYTDPLLPSSMDVPDPTPLRAALPALLATNAAVKTALEQARSAKALGSSLQSAVVLAIEDGSAHAHLATYAADLESLFVVSSVALDAPVPATDTASWRYQAPIVLGSQTVGTAWVLPPHKAKCPRCWRYMAPAEDVLCGRCDTVVAEQGQYE